jgi:hypothetical protein
MSHFSHDVVAIISPCGKAGLHSAHDEDVIYTSRGECSRTESRVIWSSARVGEAGKYVRDRVMRMSGASSYCALTIAVYMG